MKKRAKRSFGYQLKKYCRWLRVYMRRVKALEHELGGELHAC